jgi:hypothetical protein
LQQEALAQAKLQKEAIMAQFKEELALARI